MTNPPQEQDRQRRNDYRDFSKEIDDLMASIGQSVDRILEVYPEFLADRRDRPLSPAFMFFLLWSWLYWIVILRYIEIAW